MKKNKMCRALLLLLFASTSQIVSGAAAEIKIDGDTPWLVMRADYANMPIQKTIRDAERDWYKVFGYPPVIFRENSIPSRWDGPVIVFGSVENTQRLIDSQVPEGKEQHRLFLTTLASGNPSLVAAGSDTRGTVFAIYTFCEKVLGIDPMYIFTDHQPKKSSEITLAADFEIVSKKPTFEYRGWFINDEELHDGMHRDPLGGNVISMEWMDKILETLLRCKGNMIIPESSPYSDATVYDLCQRRDVVITHHHISPTGLNMMNWPKGVPFSFVTHKEILIDAWKKSVKAQQGKKVAWIIGFRGESDGAFWNSDRAAPADDAGRAAVIAEAMQTQTDIIRAVDPNATIVAALWNEQGKFYNAGLLKIPDGVCKMFADDGRGYMRDDGGVNVGPGDGFYYHVMMMMNTQNRTTEAVPPARFYSELRRYVEKGATKYAIINVSGIRPAAMSVEAITDFLWDAEPALSKTPEASKRDYLNSWYAKEFTPELASKLTNLRLKYYDIPYMREKMPIQGRWKGARGEHLIQYLAQNLLRSAGDAVAQGGSLSGSRGRRGSRGGGFQINEAREPLAETAEFFPELWEATKALASEIPKGRQDYYQSHFTYQVAVQMYSCRMLTIVCDALAAYEKNKDAQAFVQQMVLALDEQEKILAEAHKAEYGIWDTMYMHVRLMDMWRTRLLLKSTIAKIEKKPYTDNYRGFMRGSFWGSAQEYMDHAEGVYPYFYKHSGRGLDVLEDKTAARKAKIFNVKTFGAVGDGVAMDTKALQAAIDACSDNKGGIVWIPAGGYHIGTIRMKSNVTLSLDSGATLLGSQKISDYATDLSVPREGGVHCLIYAEDATNMVLEGLGVIDARGTPEAFPRGQGPRPRLMRMVNCKQITFSGLTYKNPASWGLHLIDCRNINFNSITLRFRDNQYNNDGLDLDGCEDVLIENCDLNAGDDAICLKSSLNPCKNIVVRGCEVTSDTAAFKLGTSSRGGFVDVSVTNCRFYDCPMGAIKLELVDGGRLENVKISRIVMEKVGDPIFIRLGNRGRTYQRRTGQRFNADVEPEGAPIGTLKNVRISDVVAEVTGEDKSKSGPIMISSIPGHYVENVVLENIKISYPGGGTSEDAERVVPEDIARYPEQFFFGTLPAWGAYIRHARNIEFKNVELQTRAPDKRKKIVLDDVEGFVER